MKQSLKLKASKCNFLKAHVQYLGHLISGKGIKPVPEKLESIKNMPSPTTSKEVKQFLGLIGYYRKFIPKFSDAARPLTNLTKKDIQIQTEDSVLIKDHTAGPFQPTYKGKYRVISLKGNQVEVMPSTGGKSHFVHIQDVEYILPVDTIIAELPNYDNFGRKTKLRMNPDNIPDLHWELATLANTINVTTSSYFTPKSDTISVHTLLEQRPLPTH